MENKINVAKLLKDCPMGMELDCTSYDNVSFDKISDDKKAIYPIFCYITDRKGNRSGISFTENGCESKRYGAKCVIFPKGKTTWEGFVPPCQFKNGDIISNGDFVAIFYKIGTPCHCVSPNIVYYHCYYSPKWHNFKKGLDFGIGISTGFKYATEEEKQKLFDAIKANGCKWDAETKTLEELIEPKFKAGDRIVSKNKRDEYFHILHVAEHNYILNIKGYCLEFKDQDNFELVPNKFDVSTLKPFDKVLVRDNDEQMWTADMFSFYNEKHVYPFMCVGHYTNQCIPYDQNKHLLGTTNKCDDYYKNWE